MLGSAWEVCLSTGPILRREFLGLLRSRKAFWIAVLTVGASSLIPLLYWPEDGEAAPYAVAQSAFDTYRFTFLAALSLFVTLISASAITTEREQNTYALLLSTRLHPWGIVLGKLLSGIAFFLLLLALTFPVVLLLYFLGNFNALDFTVTTIALGVLTVFLGMVGLGSSLHHARTSMALLGALGRLAAMFLILGLAFPLFPITLPLVLIHVVYRLLSAPSLPDLPLHEASARVPPSSASERIWPISWILQRAQAGIPDGWNPVLVASLRGWAPAVIGSPVVLAVGTTFIALAVLPLLALGLASLAVAGSLLILSAALGVTGLASAVVTSDLERGRRDLLRSTQLRPSEVLVGHLGTAFLGGWVFALLGGVLFCAIFPLFFLSPLAWVSFLLYFPALAAATLAASTAGILASTIAGTAPRAVAIAYLLCVGELIVPPLWANLGSNLSFVLSPLAAFAGACQGIATERGWRVLPPYFLSLALSLGIAAIQFGAAVMIYERRCLRDR